MAHEAKDPELGAFAMIAYAGLLFALSLSPPPNFSIPTPWGKVEFYAIRRIEGLRPEQTEIEFLSDSGEDGMFERTEVARVPLPLWVVLIISVLTITALVAFLGFVVYSAYRRVGRSRA